MFDVNIDYKFGIFFQQIRHFSNIIWANEQIKYDNNAYYNTYTEIAIQNC